MFYFVNIVEIYRVYVFVHKHFTGLEGINKPLCPVLHVFHVVAYLFKNVEFIAFKIRQNFVND